MHLLSMKSRGKSCYAAKKQSHCAKTKKNLSFFSKVRFFFILFYAFGQSSNSCIHLDSMRITWKGPL